MKLIRFLSFYPAKCTFLFPKVIEMVNSFCETLIQNMQYIKKRADIKSFLIVWLFINNVHPYKHHARVTDFYFSVVLVIHRQQIFPDECYPYTQLPVYTEIILFDGLEKSLCA